MKRFLTLFFFIVLAYVCSPSITLAAAFQNLQVVYEPAEHTVNISGSISSGGGKTIGLSVTDPSGNMVYIQEVASQTDGSFTAAHKLQPGSADGVYLVKAGADGLSILQTRAFVVGNLQNQIADLRSIYVGDEKLEGFDPDDTAYSTNTGANIREIRVTAVTEQNGATLKINGKMASSHSPFGPIALVNGANNIVIEVASQDGLHKKSYHLTVNATISPSTGVPGTPVLSDDNGHDTGLQDGSYRITMNMWWGNNGTQYKLYENDTLIDTQILTDHAPQAQTAVTDIAGKANGTYTYYAELINAYGTTRSAAHTVKVAQAAPSKPVLSHNNWDGDGNYSVTMNLWWGTNGTQYKLYENGVLVDTQTLTAATPKAQSASTTIQGKPAGTYEYVVELSNGSGATRSQPILIQVTRAN
ncbi:Chitinase A, N-terminal domain [Paenibacillus sp. UNCCL117]|uniref:chitinase N-terminal domain-containing protein n=1 Tax=unclassified Paenibacillus TaxID=185978 RepID=UPI00088B85FC|nr:Chitinase A, N-terminal domain [Paenibacillus sp. cl123]SFW57181.1 Chitinase A, N-terminal domain [Paenibacillus sp. UNCCL117]